MNKLALLFLGAAVALGLVSMHLVRELEAERAKARSLQARVSELQTGSVRPAIEPAVATAGPTPISPFASTARTESSVAPTAPVATPSALSAKQEAWRERQIQASLTRGELLKDPEYREAMLAQQRLGHARSHPNLAKELDLTAEQADELFTLLAEQNLRAMENSDEAVQTVGPGDPGQMQELRRKWQAQERKNEAEIAALLGSKFPAWQEYKSTLGVRWQADQMRTSLASRGLPLDESLAKPLAKALAAQQQRMLAEQHQSTAAAGVIAAFAPGDRNVQGADENVLEARARYNKQIQDAVRSVLSAEQLAVLKEEHDAELQMQRVQLRVMRAKRQAAGSDPALDQGIMMYGDAMPIETSSVTQD